MDLVSRFCRKKIWPVFERRYMTKARKRLVNDQFTLITQNCIGGVLYSFLGKRFDSKVIVLRILDSRSENFNLKKIYQSKCIVYNVITAPEIEILIIINEHQYERFKKTKNMKASSFCSQVLNIGYKKTKEYWESYFSDINDLVAAIKEYDRLSKKSNSKKGNININDLLVS